MTYSRHILRFVSNNKSYIALNTAGLSIGLAISVAIALSVIGELSFDRHFSNYENIYRVVGERVIDGDVSLSAPVTPLLGSYLTQDFPEIESFVRFRREPRTTFKFEDINLYWDNIWIADSNVFEVFDHRIVTGDPLLALSTPRSMAISQRFSNAYFGTENPVGKVVQKNGIDYTVTLVFEDLPSNTHLKYDALLSRDPRNDQVLTSSSRGLSLAAYMNNEFTYIVLPSGYRLESFTDISESIFETRLKPIIGRSDVNLRYFLEPLHRIHLYSQTEEDLPRANRFYILALVGAAIAILASAGVNYTILSTARFVKNTKNAGIRKILGASKLQLVSLSLIEPIALSIISLILGIAFAVYVLNYPELAEIFGDFSNNHYLLDARVSIAMCAAAIGFGLLSGAYGAIKLSNIDPSRYLNRASQTGFRKWSFSQWLVTFQYIISLCLTCVACIMYFQFEYMNSRHLGFDESNKLVFTIKGADAIENIDVFITEITNEQNILNATSSEFLPGQPSSLREWEIENSEGSFELRTAYANAIDENYLEAMGIQLVRGRNFTSSTSADDVRDIIVNESLVEMMDWKESIGKMIGSRPVIGVVRDYHFQGFDQVIQPLILRYSENDYSHLGRSARQNQTRYLTISLLGSEPSNTLAYIQNQWSQFFPDQPFDYQYLNQRLDSMYSSPRTQMYAISFFAAISTVIAGLGIFSLASYLLEQRTKEIAIRKIVGATSADMFLLLSNTFSRLILIAAVIASTISYLIASRWLETFYYRTNIQFLVFPAVTVSILFLSLLFISLHIRRISSRSPVLSLRHD